MSTTYATVSELKARLKIPSGSVVSDTVLQQYLDEAAETLDEMTRGYIVGKEAFSATTSEARTFNDNLYNYTHPIHDLLTVTEVQRNATIVSASDYQLLPLVRGNGPATAIQFSQFNISTGTTGNFYYNGVGYGQIQITGTWGYCTSGNRPATIKGLTLQLAGIKYQMANLSKEDLIQMVINPQTQEMKALRDMITALKRKGRGIIF